jgi:hypothetical protein
LGEHTVDSLSDAMVGGINHVVDPMTVGEHDAEQVAELVIVIDGLPRLIRFRGPIAVCCICQRGIARREEAILRVDRA